MTYVPYKKGTLWIPSGNNKHLFVILNDKCAAGCHLIVNVTSIYEGVPHDPACILEAGEHPAIKRKSYIRYDMADIQPADRLTKMTDLRYYQPGDDVSDALLSKIMDGSYETEFIKKRIAKYIDDLEQPSEPLRPPASPPASCGMTRDELLAAIESATAQRAAAKLSGDALSDSLLELRIGGLKRLLSKASSKRP